MGVLKIKNSDGTYSSINVIKGKSAYEIAVKNGFNGTEEEWLNSLEYNDAEIKNKVDEVNTKLDKKVDKENPVMTGTSISFNRKGGTTVGKNSIAIGSDSTASNENSIAIGTNTNTTGQHSVSIGVLNNATGKESVAIGVSNTARGQNAVAIGRSCVSSNEYSVATGCWTTADGIASNAFGNGSYTNGWGAMASGIVTKAHGLAQHVFGQYNKPDDNVCGTVGSSEYNYSAKSKNLMIVGNGSSSGLSNAYELDWSGNGWYAGNVAINGTPTNANHAVTIGYLNSLRPQPGKYFVNGFVSMTGDGVADFGKYIDFHNTGNDTSDYSTRLYCNGSTGNQVALPTSSGTLTTKEDSDARYAKTDHTHDNLIITSSTRPSGQVNGRVWIHLI